MKREIKARQDGGWKQVRWSMQKRPELHMLDIVHGRIMAQNPKVTVESLSGMPSSLLSRNNAYVFCHGRMMAQNPKVIVDRPELHVLDIVHGRTMAQNPEATVKSLSGILSSLLGIPEYAYVRGWELLIL